MKKKLLALLLSLSLIVSMGIPSSLAAEESTSSPSETIEQQTILETSAPDPTLEATPTLTSESAPEAPEQTELATTETTPNPDATGSPEPILDPEVTSPTETIVDPDPDPDQTTPSETTINPDETDPDETLDPDEDVDPYAHLYEQIMASDSIVAIQSILAGLSQVEEDDLISWLNENDKLLEVQARIQSLLPDVQTPPALDFTNAGPLLPAVNVGGSMRRSLMRGTGDDNGVELVKTASLNSNGSYTVRLEAFVTGNTYIETTTDPVDIVLVLDQSGSMAYDFDGNSGSIFNPIPVQNRRQTGLKIAVNNFIDKVNEKYSAESDHRIAIVTFAGSSNVLRGWTDVDTAGRTDLKGAINNLSDSPSGATNTGAGMANANTLISGNAGYDGPNTTRKKVVILFTDGEPTTGSEFDVTVADTAITQAKLMKSAGVTIYSVGIFGGANQNVLYGSGSNGTVGSSWSALVSNGSAAIAAANRFMNYVSTNFPTATRLGLKRDTRTEWLVFTYEEFTILENFDRQHSNYYLTASTANALNDIFQSISQEIGGAHNTTLTAASTIQDTVSPYFDVPTGANAVEFYTADCTGISNDTLLFGTEITATGVSGGFTDQKLTVTGFDFATNWCGYRAETNNYGGKKLIIEFTIMPKDGFLGGNGVPTNEGLLDGIYDPNGNVVEKYIAPEVDVPLKNIVIGNAQLGSYYGQLVYRDDLIPYHEVKIGSVTLDFSQNNFGLETWQNQFVDISIVPDLDEVQEVFGSFDYDITATIEPNKQGTISPSSKTGTGEVLVVKPSLTFNDSDVWYGAIPSYGEGINNVLADTIWIDSSTGDTDANLEMLNDKPIVSLNYIPEAAKLHGGLVNTKKDIPVEVEVRIPTGLNQESTLINEHTTFVHTDCTSDCGWDDLTPAPDNGDPAFLLHVKTVKLTITKTGGNTAEPYVVDINKDGVKYTEASITGSSSVTLYELPVGTYTIEEDVGWSWRYSGNNGTGVVLDSNNRSGTITCTNTLTDTYWLNGYSDVVPNEFSVATGN